MQRGLNNRLKRYSIQQEALDYIGNLCEINEKIIHACNYNTFIQRCIIEQYYSSREYREKSKNYKIKVTLNTDELEEDNNYDF